MRKIVPVVAAGVTVLAMAGGTFGFAMIGKVVTLTVDGQARQVETAAGTVAALLAAEGIDTTSHDVVIPAPDTALSTVDSVAVSFGRPVTVMVDGASQTHWTTATDVATAVGSFGVSTAGAKMSVSPSAPVSRSGLVVEVSTPKTVTIARGKKKHRVTTTGATVAEALSAAKIKPGADDVISVPTTQPIKDGTDIKVTVVKVKTVSTRKTLQFAITRKPSKDLVKGETKIVTPGRPGRSTTTFREVWRDGKRTSRQKVRTIVVTEPSPQVLLVGTKEAPKAKAVAGGGVWDKIAKCESGGNWSINTGNGFYGGLQFSLGTWRAHGGSGKPNQASREQQIAIAKKVQASQGWGAWPGCTRKLGLR